MLYGSFLELNDEERLVCSIIGHLTLAICDFDYVCEDFMMKSNIHFTEIVKEKFKKKKNDNDFRLGVISEIISTQQRFIEKLEMSPERNIDTLRKNMEKIWEYRNIFIHGRVASYSKDPILELQIDRWERSEIKTKDGRSQFKHGNYAVAYDEISEMMYSIRVICSLLRDISSSF